MACRHDIIFRLRENHEKGYITVKERFLKWVRFPSFDFRTPGAMLRLLLVIGAIHGLIYVFLIPPWWHHEEAPHLEYALLAAKGEGWPQRGDYDNQIRREMAVSMLRDGWSDYVNLHPSNLDDDPIFIGGSQVADPPLYTWLASIPLRVLNFLPIDGKLYTGRMVSLLFFLLTLWFAWLATGEILPETHPFRWLPPLFLALLPGFVEGMTAVHNDPAGAAAAAFFLYISLRWMKRGFSFRTFSLWILSLGLLYFASAPSKVFLLLAPLPPLFRYLGKKSFFLLAAVGILGGGILFSKYLRMDDALGWGASSAEIPNRIVSPDALHGTHAFLVSPDGARAFQTIPPSVIRPLRGETLTLGLWMWADKDMEVSFPEILYSTDGSDGHLRKMYPPEKISIGTNPAFYQISFSVPEDVYWMRLLLSPASLSKGEAFFCDGITLTPGTYPDSPPSFEDETLRRGTWEGIPFENLLRDASAERAGISASPELVHAVKRFLPMDLNTLLTSLQDPRGYGWYYRKTASMLFQGFWGRAAGAMVPLIGAYTYPFLFLVTLFALGGAFFAFLLSRRFFFSLEGVFLGGALLLGWGSAFFRGGGSFSIIPYARYAFPAALPTAMLLSCGFVYALSGRNFASRPLAVSLFLSFTFGLAGYAFFSFGAFFSRLLAAVSSLLFFFLLMGAVFLLLRRNASFSGSDVPPRRD